MYHGHIRRNDTGQIIGDGYTFGGDNYEVIVVGDNQGIWKNGKKMKRDEFKNMPDAFKENLRLQPEWND